MSMQNVILPLNVLLIITWLPVCVVCGSAICLMLFMQSYAYAWPPNSWQTCFGVGSGGEQRTFKHSICLRITNYVLRLNGSMSFIFLYIKYKIEMYNNNFIHLKCVRFVCALSFLGMAFCIQAIWPVNIITYAFPNRMDFKSDDFSDGIW